ncbi:MAG: cupin domain-containing protein [Crocinitomix sp.]|nr:cupin domain-containing protein [Crocinitomix sp.]|tara:strand:- start:855 stop:1373 length:519 start_codon:yes stop_codon:yes gene_type:complete
MENNSEAEIAALVSLHELLPHPEGGYYKELYRSEGVISAEELSPKFNGSRNYCTSIYFLLTSSNFSGFHRIKQDEVWHFYHGSPLTVHVIDMEGKYTAHKVGFSLSENLAPQLVVPAGCWFASSVEEGNSFSFVGCTVAPGFDFADFELAERDSLSQVYPQHAEIIRALTRI